MLYSLFLTFLFIYNKHYILIFLFTILGQLMLYSIVTQVCVCVYVFLFLYYIVLLLFMFREVSQPQHHWHLELENSSSGEALLCPVGSLALTQQM